MHFLFFFGFGLFSCLFFKKKPLFKYNISSRGPCWGAVHGGWAAGGLCLRTAQPYHCNYRVRPPPRPSRWAAAGGERAAAAADGTAEEAILPPLREEESEAGRRPRPGGTRPPAAGRRGSTWRRGCGLPAGATRYCRRVRPALAARGGSAGEPRPPGRPCCSAGPCGPSPRGGPGRAERGRQEALSRRPRRAGRGVPQRVNARAAAPGCPCRETGEKERTARRGGG